MVYKDYSKEELIVELDSLRVRVAELEQVNKSLQQKEKRYGHLMATMSDGVVIEDKMNRIVYVNQSFCETLGFHLEALVGWPMTDIIHPEGIELYLEQTGRRPYEQKASYEQKMRGANGRTIPVIISVQALQNETGEYDGCLTVITDISAQKEAEEALRRSEEEFRNLFENAQAGVYRTTLDGSRYLMANQTLADIFEMSKEELLHCSPRDTWADPAEREKLIRRIKEKGVLKNCEIRGVTKSGKIITTLASIKFYPEQGYLEGITLDITERKRLEEALRASEERYRSLVEGAGFPIFLLDREGRFRYINWIGATGLGGYPRDFVGKSMWEVFPQPVADYQMRIVEQVFETGEEMEVESIIPGEEEKRWFHTSINPVRDAAGAVESVIGIAVDITEQKKAQEVLQRDRDELERMVAERTKDLLGANLRLQSEIAERERAEAALRESEATARALLNAPTDAIMLLDTDGRILDANETFARRFKKKVSEMIGTNSLALAEELRVRRTEALDIVNRTGCPYRFEDERDGFWNDNVLYPILDGEGAVQKVAVISRDITERKRQEAELRRHREELEDLVAERTAELRRSEKKYRQVIENSQDIFYAISPEGIVTFISPQVMNLGYREAEVVGHSMTEFVHAEDTGTVMGQLLETLQTGKTQLTELRLRRKDGGYLYLEGTGEVVYEEGRINKIVGSLRDISERKRAEAILRESEQRFRLLFDHVSDGILLVEAQSRKVFTGNPMMCRLLGYRLEELDGLYFKDIHPREDIPQIIQIFEQGVREGTLAATGIAVKRKDGSVFYADINATLIILEGQRYLMGVFRDITERLEVQAQLQQFREKMVRAERLASLGAIGANLMHQLNQPFTVIRLMLEDCQAELAGRRIPERVRSNIVDGLAAIAHAEAIVGNYRKVIPRTGTQEEVIDLGKIARQVVQVFSDGARRSKIQLILEGLEQVPKTTGNPSDLEQIFFNLIENAIHAADERVEQQLRIRAVLRDQILELEFSDNCGGIEPRYQDKIFEMFFTTKAQGTGLGLAIVEQIISQRGGKIRMESRQSQGTTFYISLPWIL